jgi:hypothetical protein
MWRVIITLVAVVVIDFLLLVVSVGPLDENMGKISKALRAREENPTLETQRTLIAALDEPYQERNLKRVWSLSLFL